MTTNQGTGMATPQHGIFEESSTHHQYLEYTVGERDAGSLVAALAKACADARALAEASDTRVVVAFGADLWRRIYGVADGEVRDRLTAYSKAVTGSYWFAPSGEELSTLLRSA